MEFSPLQFLDYDASQMLSDQVRISQEDEARKFHIKMYISRKDLFHGYTANWHLQTITEMFEEIGYLLRYFE